MSHRTSQPRNRVLSAAGLLLGAGLLLSGCANYFTDDAGDGGDEAVGATAPDPSLAEDREWTGELSLNGDPVSFTLDGSAAPQAVASFITLAEDGYFDGIKCHRLTTSGIFVLQCGDPTGQGNGGPGYTFGPIENAPDDGEYPAGQLAMARLGDDGESMGSQFFIVYEDSDIPSDSAGGYTVFGEVTGGLDVVTAIAGGGVAGGAASGTPAIDAVIDGISVE